jgi:hypothetical protein
MKTLITFVFAALIYNACIFAQPVLTAANSNPIIGEAFKWNYTSGITSVGSGGANQTWDYSTLTSTLTQYDSVIYPSSAMYGAGHYPNANICFCNNCTGGPYSSCYLFYQANSDSLTDWGNACGSDIEIYNNPSKSFIYPFTYKSAYLDSCRGTDNDAGTNYTVWGSVYDTADGYGTLKLPSGVYSNVLRIKQITFSASKSSSGTVTSGTNTVYLWYLPGNHQPILSISTINQSASYLSTIILGINDDKVSSNMLKLFPNPSTDIITVNSQQLLVNGVEIYNALGEKVYLNNRTIEQKNSRSIEINVSSFPSGVYFVKVKTEKGVAVRKFVKE